MTSQIQDSVRSAIRRDTRQSIDAGIREHGPHSVWRSIRSVVADMCSDTTVLPQLSSEVVSAERRLQSCPLNHFVVSAGA